MIFFLLIFFLPRSPAGQERVFAEFTTPDNSISGSADIRDSGDGPFKVQQMSPPTGCRCRDMRSRDHGRDNSRDVGDEHLNLLKENVLLARNRTYVVHRLNIYWK